MDQPETDYAHRIVEELLQASYEYEQAGPNGLAMARERLKKAKAEVLAAIYKAKFDDPLYRDAEQSTRDCGNTAEQTAAASAPLTPHGEALIAAEREACAKVVEQLFKDYVWCKQVAAAIRGRKDD